MDQYLKSLQKYHRHALLHVVHTFKARLMTDNNLRQFQLTAAATSKWSYFQSHLKKDILKGKVFFRQNHQIGRF
jgi:hypothetical protein